MLLNSQWITEEIKEESKIYLETNEIMMIQNQWDIAIGILRRMFRAIKAYLRKQEKC